MKRMLVISSSLALFVAAAGCSSSSSTPETSAAPTPTTSIDGSAYLLDAEPQGAADIIQIREAAADSDDVVVVGRIGGSHNPWVEGSAAFSIVDRSLKACSDIEGDQCPAPWDYCCESADNLAASTALVKLVDENGQLVKTDARELLNVKELQTVVVRGKAKRDDAGNLTVLASEIYIKE